MRVLVTTPDLRLPGGVSNYFLVLRPHLENIADYYTVGLRAGENSKIRAVLRLFSDYARFAARLVSGRYDLVHINPSFGSRALPREAIFLLLAKLLRRPVLVFVRGWDPNCEEQVSGPWKRLFRAVYGRADAVIVLAAEYARKLREFGYAGRIECETTVTDPGFVPALPLQYEGDRDRGRFRILFLARLEKDKGLYEAIDAYRVVKARHELAEFVVAGAGAESENAARYVRENAIPDVHFLGHVTGSVKGEVFGRSHLYLFPSYYEGMPNSVLEAMACGLPVVTSNVGGIADFFEDGRMGFLIDSLQPEAIAGLIERMIADRALAAQMGELNRQYAERRFSAATVARRLTDIYSSMIGRNVLTNSNSAQNPSSLPAPSQR